MTEIEADDQASEPGAGAAAAAAGAATAGLACLSCGAGVVGPFCPSCGQKNDDLRRSSFLLAKDFFRDTFGFDSRMWRTLGLMATAPGLVPQSYAHGRRSRFTPPIRLFLVVSFLFFLTLGLSQTLVVAFEVTPMSAAEIAAEELERERARALASAVRDAAEAEAAAEPEADGLVVIGGEEITCPINIKIRFFVRPQDVAIDQAAWRRCADSIRAAAEIEIEGGAAGESGAGDPQEARAIFERALKGATAAVEDPRALNAEVNAWLPRVLFVMTPVLALLIALFIRGRDALLFDNLVLSFYSHAVGFAVVAAAILAARFGAPHAGAVAATALALYFLLAMKRAYRRGWIKTAWSATSIAFLYFAILSAAVTTIVGRAIWLGG